MPNFFRRIPPALMLVGLMSGTVAHAEDYTKFNPGHYAKIGEGGNAAHLDGVLGVPYIKGIILHITWKELEPSKDQYDFSKIDSFLEILSPYKQHLILIFIDYSSRKECAALPDYLVSMGVVATTKPLPGNPEGGGCMVKLWDDRALERWNKLNQAVGKRYDLNPYFEGIRTRESTYPVDKKAEGYTNDKLVANLIQLGIEAKKAMPHTNYFLSLSRIGGPTNTAYMRQVIDGVLPHGVGLAWPDTIAQLNNPKKKIPIWDLAKEYTDRMPIIVGGDTSGAQVPETNEENRIFTQRVFQLAVDDFKANYFYWPKTVKSSFNRQPVSAYYEEAVKVIQAEHGWINTTCPSNIEPCRATD